MPTVSRHKHRRLPNLSVLAVKPTGRKGSTNRKIIAGIIALHPAPKHRTAYTLHATKGYRSRRID